MGDKSARASDSDIREEDDDCERAIPGWGREHDRLDLGFDGLFWSAEGFENTARVSGNDLTGRMEGGPI